MCNISVILNNNAFLPFLATLPSSSEAMWKVSADDISKLKHGLVSVFTDSFSSQLLATTQVLDL